MEEVERVEEADLIKIKLPYKVSRMNKLFRNKRFVKASGVSLELLVGNQKLFPLHHSLPSLNFVEFRLNFFKIDSVSFTIKVYFRKENISE